MRGHNMEKLEFRLASSLRWFASENHMDVCIELSNQLGRFFPSEADGRLIKLGQIRDLAARGFISRALHNSLGVCYWRYTISELGRSTFKEYTDACSK